MKKIWNEMKEMFNWEESKIFMLIWEFFIIGACLLLSFIIATFFNFSTVLTIVSALVLCIPILILFHVILYFSVRTLNKHYEEKIKEVDQEYEEKTKEEKQEIEKIFPIGTNLQVVPKGFEVLPIINYYLSKKGTRFWVELKESSDDTQINATIYMTDDDNPDKKIYFDKIVTSPSYLNRIFKLKE